MFSVSRKSHNLDELVEDKTLVDDGLAVALGEDSGCLDPDFCRLRTVKFFTLKRNCENFQNVLPGRFRLFRVFQSKRRRVWRGNPWTKVAATTLENKGGRDSRR